MNTVAGCARTPRRLQPHRPHPDWLGTHILCIKPVLSNVKGGTPTLPPLQAVKVLDQLRERIRYLHYSRRTEEAYVHRVKRFIRFHGVRDPREMGQPEVEASRDSWLAPSPASGFGIGPGESFGRGAAPPIAG